MSNKEMTTQSTLTAEQIELNNRLGIPMPNVEGEVLVPEVVEVPKTSETPVKEVKTRKFSFKIENSLGGEEPRKERFKLSEEDEQLKQFLITKNEDFKDEDGNAITPSLFLARQRNPRVYINTVEESTGLKYGVFNGAGPRAITMYNPDHPDAPTSGPNYGKVFYHWNEERVVKLLHAIFDEYFVEKEVEETQEE